jgi:hypothetical protein
LIGFVLAFGKQCVIPLESIAIVFQNIHPFPVAIGIIRGEIFFDLITEKKIAIDFQNFDSLTSEKSHLAC